MSSIPSYNTLSTPSQPSSPSPNVTVSPSAPFIPPGADEFSVMIWGPKSSGKTMFLYMLRDAMSNAKYMSKTDWTMRPDEAASKFLNDLDELKFSHYFSTPTPESTPEEMIFQFTCRDEYLKTELHRYLRVRDMPGEWLQGRADPVGRNVVDEYLRKCKGLLCLIDPNGKVEDTAKYFSKLLTRLQALCNKPTDKRLALCITKMDERRHRERREPPVTWAHSILGNTMTEIRETFLPTKIKCFFSSSVGMYPNYSPVRSNSGIDWQGKGIIYKVVNIQPFGLVEPLCDWLFLD